MNIQCPHCNQVFELSSGNSHRTYRPLTEIPEQFSVTDQHREFAKKNECRRPEEIITAFSLHHSARGNKFKNWDRAFMTWMLKDKEIQAKLNKTVKKEPGGTCPYCKTKTVYNVKEFGLDVYRCSKCERKLVRG